MKHIKTQTGYTMVLVLGVFVIFTILGLSMMTMTMRGVEKSESRESNVQAQDLAMKGIEEILSEISFKMTNETVNGIAPSKNGLQPDKYESKIKFIFDSYSCSPTNSSKTTNTGKYSFCIDTYSPIVNQTLFSVNFKAVGESNKATKTVYTTYEIGTSYNPIENGYVIATYQSQNGNGNVDIHGGVSIVGNIRAQNNLNTSNKSKFKENVNIKSVYPTIKNSNNTSSYIEIGNKAITKQNISSNNVIKEELTLSDSSKTSITNLSNVTVNHNITNKTSDMKSQITNNMDYVNTHELNSDYSLPIKWSGGNPISFLGRNITTDKANVQIKSTTYPIRSLNDRVTWNLTGDNKFKNVYFQNSLYLQYGVKATNDNKLEVFNTHPRLTVSNAFIGKDFIIGLDIREETNFDLFDAMLQTDLLGLLSGLEALSNIETTVELSGNYYVQGDLIISAAKLSGTANIYVNGNTTIMFSELGRNSNQTNQLAQINIISKGPVKMSYISNNHNKYNEFSYLPLVTDDSTRSHLKGHIHSDTSITIDGATSYLTIEGSLSAPNISVTSIKGRAVSTCNNLLNVIVDDLKPMERYQDTNSLASNCFEFEGNQTKETVKVSKDLLKLLATGIELPYAIIDYPVTPRVEIIYREIPNFTVKNNGLITTFDPPKLISRE